MMYPPSINSFDVLGVDIKFYGITMAVALICALCVVFFISEKIYNNKINPNFILDLFPIVTISGIIGLILLTMVVHLVW